MELIVFFVGCWLVYLFLNQANEAREELRKQTTIEHTYTVKEGHREITETRKITGNLDNENLRSVNFGPTVIEQVKTQTINDSERSAPPRTVNHRKPASPPTIPKSITAQIEQRYARPKDDHKTCSNCGEARPKADFFKSKKQPDGLTKWCKHCHNS